MGITNTAYQCYNRILGKQKILQNVITNMDIALQQLLSSSCSTAFLVHQRNVRSTSHCRNVGSRGNKISWFAKRPKSIPLGKMIQIGLKPLKYL